VVGDLRERYGEQRDGKDESPSISERVGD
jgi:hypothetical protein